MKIKEIAKNNDIKRPVDWHNFRETNKKPNAITKYPERVYSKQNVLANEKAGVDIKKVIYY